MSQIVYILLTGNETMVAEGERVTDCRIMEGGVLRYERPNGDLMYLAAGEWRRLYVPSKDRSSHSWSVEQ